MKVFVSHSSYDKWVARQITRLLEEAGHTTFLDEKDIRTGESIDASIQAHLKDSDHLLLLITPTSLKSQWVLIELGGAKALGKHVVPIYMHVEANELPSAISSLLGREINEFDKYLSELKKASTSESKLSEPKTAASEEAAAKKRIAPKSQNKHVGGFSVGDEVRIAEITLLTDEDKSKAPKWVRPMDKYSGSMSKITAFSPKGWAYLEVTGDRFRWNLDWLTKAG